MNRRVFRRSLNCFFDFRITKKKIKIDQRNRVLKGCFYVLLLPNNMLHFNIKPHFSKIFKCYKERHMMNIVFGRAETIKLPRKSTISSKQLTLFPVISLCLIYIGLKVGFLSHLVLELSIVIKSTAWLASESESPKCWKSPLYWQNQQYSVILIAWVILVLAVLIILSNLTKLQPN